MSKTFDFPAPRPWRIVGKAIRDRNGDVVMSALNPANMETRKLIVDAVNGKTEADAPIPLPFDMAKARDEASRRYQETHQEFWAGLADLLADGVAFDEYHTKERAEVKRLRAFINELCDCLEEEDADAYRTLISRAKEAAQAHATTENEAINAANEVERLRNVLRGFADEWDKYAEQENMRAPAWASCFRSFARDCRKAIGGE